MTDLNERYMGEDRPTDVLAFPIDGPSPASGRPRGRPGRGGSRPTASATPTTRTPGDDEEDDDAPWLLGDIVLCPAYAAEQATRNGQSLAAELELLTVHGILHLCGFDHAEPDEERPCRPAPTSCWRRWRAGERPNRLTTTDIWSLVAVVALTAIAAFLAAAETGLTRMSRARAMHLREEQRRGSAQLLALVEKPARFLNLVLLLVLVVQFFATALFTSVMNSVVGGGW